MAPSRTSSSRRARPASRRRLGALTGPLVLAFVLVLALAACGDDDAAEAGAPSSEPPTTAPTSEPAADPAATDAADPAETTEPADTTTTTEVADAELDSSAPDLGRVVVLAEEGLLADVLALGVEPIASSASVPEVGFQGMGDADTSGIEILPMTTLNLEHVATLQPDTIVTLQFWLDQIGPDQLEGLADVIAIPDGLALADRLTTLGEELGRPEHAAAVVAEHEAGVADAAARVGDGCTLSLAAIYPGPSVAAFVAGPWELPTSILDTGCQLDPDAAQAEPDGNGRVWLSLEQLGMLDADVLVLLQNDNVEGEPEAVDEIEANQLWTALPAVGAGEVHVFDRLGYAGAPGQIRFLQEFSEQMAS